VSTPAGASAAIATDAPVTVVRRFNAAWAAHDLAAALALTSDDCVFESTAPPDGERSTGQAEIRAAWQPIFDDVASAFSVEETIEAGPRVVQRWRYDWTGGHVRGVDIFTVADGRITQKAAYVKG
jgi:ketosteroid isomerase-like protein